MACVIVRNTIVGACALAACVASAGRAVGQPVTFTDHIRPIMERSCWNCHGEAAQLSELDLRSRESSMAGGTRGRPSSRDTPRRAVSTGWWPVSMTR